MEKLVIKKSIEIKAPKEKVWEVLLSDETYRQWTKPFAEGSFAEFEDGWPKGSKVLFKDGAGSGMVSRVAAHVPNEMISFEHLGMIDKDGTEDLTSEEVKKWQGSRESYYASESDGVTTLRIEMDGWENEDMDKFSAMWDAALLRVKELAEA